MIALFVTTETCDPGPAPTRVSASSSAVSSACARGGDLLRGRLALEQDDETRRVAVAVPEEPLDLLEQPGREPAQPLLRSELEDAVRLEPRLLGATPLAGRRGGLDAIERRGDHVEVGSLGRVAPRLRERRLDQPERRVRRRPHLVRVGDPVAASGRGKRVAEPGQLGAELSRRRLVTPQQRRLEIAEGTGRAVPERDRLLDLEVEHHAAVTDAAAVLDRHEPEEAVELTRSSQLLARRERGGAEALEERD